MTVCCSGVLQWITTPPFLFCLDGAVLKRVVLNFFGLTFLYHHKALGCLVVEVVTIIYTFQHEKVYIIVATKLKYGTKKGYKRLRSEDFSVSFSGPEHQKVR